MGLSIAFILIIIILSVGLLKRQGQRMAANREDYWKVFMIAIVVGLWSAFAFTMPGAVALWGYHEQGKVDVLASDIPRENPPPIVPAMSLTQFMAVAIPSALGVLGALLYVVFAFVSAFKKRIFRKWTYWLVGYALISWILCVALFSFFLPLPSIEQNVTFFLVMGLPCILCIAFNLFWLYWTDKQKPLETS